MPQPFEKLDPSTRRRVLDELRSILQDPDPESVARRRKNLAEGLRTEHPDVAEWVEQDVPDDPGGQMPVLDTLPVSEERKAALVGRIVLIKYGGNAMVDDAAKQNVIADICALKSLGVKPVVVHGGGPAISELLGKVGVKSRFIGGHRKTDRTSMGYVEMALSGKVNSEIVKLIGFNGFKSVGISGKDGGLVTATKRIHEEPQGEFVRRADLGQVGDVLEVNTDLIDTLLDGDYIPVIAPIGVGEDMEDYNINADMFAGHMATALGAKAYVAMTDVDGLFIDKDDPATLIPVLSPHAARGEIGRIVQGGMIPKIESCLIATDGGVDEAHIVNGMAAHAMLKILLTEEPIGTTIRATHEEADHGDG